MTPRTHRCVSRCWHLRLHFEHSVSVAAPPQQVFDGYVDVARWPEWLETMTSVERLDDGPLRVSSRTRIKQPRLPVADGR